LIDYLIEYNRTAETMSSSWGPKLEKKLNALADSASKESIQTLTNWIGFNRKHAPVISKTLVEALTATTTLARQWLYWQVVHEILLSNKSDSTKWDRLADLRTAIGEGTVVPAIEALGSRTLAEKVETLLNDWDDHNVFGGPTMIGQIRRLLTSSAKGDSAPVPAKAVAAVAAPAAPEPKAPPAPASAEPTTATSTKDTEDTSKPMEDQKTEQRRRSVSSVTSAPRRGSLSSITEIDYDFDSKVCSRVGKLSCIGVLFSLYAVFLTFSFPAECCLWQSGITRVLGSL
jgi:hypothetical protein